MSELSREVAPEGYLWVCHACGKTATDPYHGTRGWDESCFLNSALERVADLAWNDQRTRVVAIGSPIIAATR